MRRRLYFILPDSQLASKIATELEGAGIDAGHITVACREPNQVRIPDVNSQDPTTDPGDLVEKNLWNLNLAIFFISVLSLPFILAIHGLTFWLVIPVGILIVSFVGGLRFTDVPNTHLREFTAALHHGELVLIVSVPRARVAEIEALVQRNHPDAALGGVGWSSDLLHI
jgi:hypothetical protein